MEYKKNYPEVKRRLASLYAREAPDRIFARFSIPTDYIHAYTSQFPEGETPYPDMDSRISFWDGLLAQMTDLQDDSVPAAYLSELDEGLYAAVTGSKIAFSVDRDTGWISSMSYPLSEQDLANINLSVQRQGIWYQRYLAQLARFKEASRGKYGVSHFILIDGMNFLFEIRGATQAYLDVLETPELAQKLMDCAFALNVEIQEQYFKTIGLFEGGTVSNFAGWIPGRIVSESVDPFHLASPEFYQRWGRDNVQKMFDHFDGGVLHLHTNGHHLLKEVSALRGLKAVLLLEEKTAPIAPWQKLQELRDDANGVPLAVPIGFDAFERMLFSGDLPGNMLYCVDGAPNAQCVNDLMKKVREYRAKR